MEVLRNPILPCCVASFPILRQKSWRSFVTTHSTHFIYGYMASDIWLRTILIVRKETRCRHIGYSFRLAARVLLYAPSHRQDSIYHGLCYTSRGALAGSRNMKTISFESRFQMHATQACSLTTGPNSSVALLNLTVDPLSYFSFQRQYSTTGVTKAVVCVILSVG